MTQPQRGDFHEVPRDPGRRRCRLAPPPLFAAPADPPRPSRVRYADLDLSTEAGQEQLERRIDSAARTACGMDEIRTGRVAVDRAAPCYEQTKANVHEQVAETIARGSSRG